MIMKASSSVATTMMGVSAFGRTWRTRRRTERLPRARAPLTNSRSRMERTSARTMRELYPARHCHDQDHVEQTRAEGEDHTHGEEDVRDGEKDVDHAHDEGVGAAAVESREQAQGDSDQA